MRAIKEFSDMDLPNFPKIKFEFENCKAKSNWHCFSSQRSIPVSFIYSWSIPVLPDFIPPYQWNEEVTLKSLQPLTLQCAVRVWRQISQKLHGRKVSQALLSSTQLILCNKRERKQVHLSWQVTCGSNQTHKDKRRKYKK